MATCTFPAQLVPGNPVAPATEPLPTVAYELALKHTLGEMPLESYSRETKPLISPEVGGYAHGFIATVNTAYQNHYPLVLSPDMIWLLIAQGLAIHVRENAEALRGKFVVHAGKIELKVRRDAFVKGFAGNDWEGVFAEFSQQIRTHIGEQAHETIAPTFSTTGIVEKAAFEVTLMDAVQGYFDYLVITLCGIPTYYLEGTPEDWRSLRERAVRLADYELSWWIEPLLPVLDECIAASEGRANPEFWQEFYKWKDASGGPLVTGHIVNFFPYLVARPPTPKSAADSEAEIYEAVERVFATILEYLETENVELNEEEKEEVRSKLLADKTQQQTLSHRFYRNSSLGKRLMKRQNVDRRTGIPQPGPDEFGYSEGLTSPELPIGFSQAPFLWRYLDSEYSMEFLAGFVGGSQDPETLAVRPEIGWAVRERGSS